MSERQSTPAATTRKGVLTTSTSILKGCCSLAFLLVFLLAAMGTASALTPSTTTLNIGLPATPGSSIAGSSVPYGTSVTLTAVVGTNATGTVEFKSSTSVGGAYTDITLCGSVQVNFGEAICTTPALPLTTVSTPATFDNVQAIYSGDGTFSTSTSSALTLGITQTTPTTTLAGVLTGSSTTIAGATETYGTSVTLTAVVSGTSTASSSPGNVNFTYSNASGPITSLCSIAVVAAGSPGAGTATCITAVIPGGNNTLSAIFNTTSGGFASSAPSNTISYDVNAAETTTTTLAMSPVTTAAYGSSVTLTATEICSSVTCSGAAGTVSFTYGATSGAATTNIIPGCGAVNVSSGTAGCVSAVLPVGANFYEAAFTPTNTSDFTISASTPATYTITAAAPTLNVATSSPSPAFGSLITLTVTGLPAVAGGTGDSLAFAYGTSSTTAANDITPLTCSNTITFSAGTATCTTNLLPVAANYVKASFTAGTATKASTGTVGPFVSNLVAVTPTKVTPTVVLTTSPSGTAIVGGSVTLIATVTPGADAGNVAFTWGTAASPTGTFATSCAAIAVSATLGTATCTITGAGLASSLLHSAYNTGGGYYLQAVYTPHTAGNFTGTIPVGTAQLIVTAAPGAVTTTTVTSGTPNYYGATQLTATVGNCASSCSGSVTFKNSTTTLGTVAVNASGVATLILPASAQPGLGTTTSVSYTSPFTSTSASFANSTPDNALKTITVVSNTTTTVAKAWTGTLTAPTVPNTDPTGGAAVSATAPIHPGSSFTLYATVAPNTGTVVALGGHVSFYDVSSTVTTLLGTVAVTPILGTGGTPTQFGVASLTVNCATVSATCTAALLPATHYFTASYGGVYDHSGTGTTTITGSTSASWPVLVNGLATLTITGSSPSVVYGTAATALPTITPVYTITGGALASGDSAHCSNTTGTFDSYGNPNYTCTSVPSLSKQPLCAYTGTTYTATTAVGVSATTTTCSGAADANYTIATAPGAVTVVGKTPVWTFNAVEGSYGTQINFNATVAGPDAGAITYTVDTSLTCSPCSTTQVTHLSATAAVGTYYVTAHVAADATHGYAAATARRSFFVTQVTPVVAWPIPSAIRYGSLLSASHLGSCTAKGGSATVSGACSWANSANASSTKPNVGDTASALFTPSPSYGTAYAAVTETIPVNVTPQTPIIITPPTATAVVSGSVVYNASGNISKLGTNGVANNAAGNPVGGTWSWTCAPTYALVACPTITGSTHVSVTFTPSGADYTAVSSTNNATSATVTTATQVTVTWPTFSTSHTYGTPLSSISALGDVAGSAVAGVTNVPGTFTWTTPQAGGTTPANTYPAEGTTNVSMTFTPSDTATYEIVVGTVALTVSAMAPTVSWSAIPAPGIYAGSLLSASAIGTVPATRYVTGRQGLPVTGTFSWDSSANAPGSTTPPIGTTGYTADFTSTNADYSSTQTGTVYVTVNPCGYQDSASYANDAFANYVTTDLTGSLVDSVAGATFPLSLTSSASNESVLCAVNASATDTSVTTTVATPDITQASVSLSDVDSINYGSNAAVLAYGFDAISGDKGATITITDGGTTHASDGTAGSISASGIYTAGVFASMNGTVDITNTNIATTGKHSPALAATYNGTLEIYNVTATTAGSSDSDSGVIVTGTGGGQVTVNGGSYTNNGSGSDNAGLRVAGSCPLSAATCKTQTALTSSNSTPWSAVTVNDGVYGTSISSVAGPAVVVEGANSVVITSSGNNTALSGALGNNYGVFLYQSGTLTDASPVTNDNPTIFSMTGGSLNYACDASSVNACAGTGQVRTNDQNLKSTVFSVTNTTATITLEDVAVTNGTNTSPTADSILLTAAQLSTGPATVAFNLLGEAITGDVIVDTGSTVNMSLAIDGNSVPTTWTGTFGNGIYYDSGTSGPQTQGTVNLTLDATSTWIVTASSVTVNQLTGPHSNIFCASNNSGCTVNITHPASSFSPNTHTDY